MSETKLTRYRVIMVNHGPEAMCGPYPDLAPTKDGQGGNIYLASDADALLAERDAEIARLNRVIEDYGKQIRERHECDTMAALLAGQPQAWVVNCPSGHEYDAMVFPSQEDAEVRAETFNDDYPDGENQHVAVPLYATDQISQLTAHRETVRVLAAECRVWRSGDFSRLAGPSDPRKATDANPIASTALRSAGEEG